MVEKTQSMDGYYAAMNWLYEHRPHMMSYIASLGAPKSDRRCDRAMVVADRDMKPKLYVNDDFLQEIGPAQAAGVLVHEWRHVLLDHLGEAANPKPAWRYPRVLDDVHEVVINDNIELSGYELPDDVIRGENRGPHFYGYWDTDQGYGPMERWYLDQQQTPPPQEDGENSNDSSEEQREEDSDETQSGESGSDSGSSQSESGSGSGSGVGTSGNTESADSSTKSEENGSEDSDEPITSDGTESSDSSTEESSDGDFDESPKSGKGEPANTDGDASADEADSAASTDGENFEVGADGNLQDGEEPSEAGAGTTDGADESDGEPKAPGSCDFGAFIEDENGELREMDEAELDEFRDALNQIKITVISQNPMPKDEKPSEGELDAMDQDVAEAIDPSRQQAYSKAGHSADPAEDILSGGKLQLGWLKLLQKVNPKVGKSGGKLNAKASYNWARPRRSTSLIRGANLPTAGTPRDQGAGTSHRPVALIALDFSGSIDRRLAYALRDMAQSIPEEHIDARCFTFSTVAIPFDPKASKNRTASGGTDFSCLELEARKIQKETGEYPYVICLTDGEAWFEGYSYNSYRPATGTKPTDAQLATHWLWVDVLTEDDSKAFRNGKAYPQVQAQLNKSALPYDRSKL